MTHSNKISALQAFFAPLSGLGYLFSSGLRRYVLVPLAINILIFALIAWVGFVYFDEFLHWALPQEGWLSYLQWLLWPIFVLAYALMVFFGFTLLANLIGAPFNGQLAAQAELKFSGKLPPESSQSLFKEILPAVLGELGKLAYFVLLAVPLLFLMLIPGVNALAAILWALLGFWFLTLEYFDYPLANHGVRPGAQRRLLRKQPLAAWAFGAGVSLLMLTPGINLAAMPAAVIGATRLSLEMSND